jgi:hypothetical protein
MNQARAGRRDRPTLASMLLDRTTTADLRCSTGETKVGDDVLSIFARRPVSTGRAT